MSVLSPSSFVSYNLFCKFAVPVLSQCIYATCSLITCFAFFTSLKLPYDVGVLKGSSCLIFIFPVSRAPSNFNHLGMKWKKREKLPASLSPSPLLPPSTPLPRGIDEERHKALPHFRLCHKYCSHIPSPHQLGCSI